MSVKRVNLHKHHQSPIGFEIHALQANHIQADSPETRQADSHICDHKERATPVRSVGALAPTGKERLRRTY